MIKSTITLVVCAGVFAAAASPAVAQPVRKPAPPPPPPPPTAKLPAAGDALELVNATGWPKLDWLYDVPAPADAAGKIVVHWFCTTTLKVCTDDLARVIALRDGGHAYIVAYIDGSKYDTKKLDPIRESEGVGRGTVAYGAGVTKLEKQMGISGKATSIVVDTDGKVALVTSASTADALDARDAKVNSLAGDIHAFTTAFDAPKTVKAGDKFTLKVTVKLASWLTWQQPIKFDVSAPKDIKCDARSLAGDQLKPDGQSLVAAVTCTAPRGSYEAQGHITFNYGLPTKETGIGEDGTTWKFEVTQ